MLPRELLEPLLERDDASIEEQVRSLVDTAGFGEALRPITQFAILAYSPGELSRCSLAGLDALAVLEHRLDQRTLVDQLVELARMAADARRPWSEAPLTTPPSAAPIDGSSDALEAAVRSGDRLAAERWIAFHHENGDFARRLFDVASRISSEDHAPMRTTALAWRLAHDVPDSHRFAVLRIAAVEWCAGHEMTEAGRSGGDAFEGASTAARLAARYLAEEGSPLRLLDLAALDAAILGAELGSKTAIGAFLDRVRIPEAGELEVGEEPGTIEHSPRRDFAAALTAWGIAERRTDAWDDATLTTLRVASRAGARSGAWTQEEPT